MSYARMDHAGWVRNELRKPLSPLGEKVATILGIAVGGIYNAPINHRKVDWAGTYCIRVPWAASLATFDRNCLTLLVLLCHEARVRMSIGPCGPRHVELLFHQRSVSEHYSRNHPNIDQAVAAFRAYLGPDHPITYSAPADRADQP